MNLNLSDKFIKVIFLLSFIIFTFITSTSTASASNMNFAYYNTVYDLPAMYTPGDPAAVACTDSQGCSDTVFECWNDQSVGTTSCGNACSGGNTWSHYDRQGCWQTSYDEFNNVENCTTTYTVLERSYSTGDKCISGENGLRTGYCNGSYGPSVYKYCCASTGAAEACTTSGATQDGAYPDEGQCPGGYTVDGFRVRSSACPGAVTHYSCSGTSCNIDPNGSYTSSNCDDMCPRVDSASLNSCSGSPRTLYASWSGSSNTTDCNIYFNTARGDTGSISHSCNNSSWSGNNLPGYGAVEAGSDYILKASDGTNTRSSSTVSCPAASSPWATLTSGCSGTIPHLDTSWGNIGSGTNNIYIQAGSCPYQVGTNNTGSDSNRTNLGSCGSVVNGGIYHLYASNSGGSLVAQAGDVTPNCASASPSPSPSAAPAGCNNTALSITSNPSTIGNSITFHYNPGQDTWIGGDTWSGGVTGCNLDSNLSNRNYYCTAQSAVTNATWTHYWKINNNTTQCFKTANYTINATVPPTPTISPMPACIASGYDGSGITISWAAASPAVNYIDISTSSTFNTFYNKQILSGTSTPATGFGTNGGYWNGSSWSSQTLVFQANTTYYVRSYNGSLNSNPPPGSFTTPVTCLSASCSVSPASTTVGGPVAWTAAPLGGTGTYTYTWTGTDSLSGNTQVVNKIYTTAGTKTGLITVTSGAQSTTTNCLNSLTVTSPPCPGGPAPAPTGRGACGGIPQAGRPDPSSIGVCNGNNWTPNHGPSNAYDIWCVANTNPSRGYCYTCQSDITPWIQTTGDVHSNTRINAPGGPP